MTVSVPSPHPLHSSVLWFLSASASLLGHAFLKDEVRSILLTIATLEPSTEGPSLIEAAMLSCILQPCRHYLCFTEAKSAQNQVALK